VSTLREYERRRQESFAAIAGAGASAERLAALVSLGSAATEAAVAAGRLDPLDASDREQELVDALERRGVADPFEIASGLAEAGLAGEWIDRVAGGVGEDGLTAGLRFVAACAGARIVLAELEDATARISDLVGAVKSYSYLDQAPRQTVDVHGGLESTLSLLAHKLRDKRIEIVRDYEADLPAVEASGSELNQVWTNLIDNAVDALDPGGRISLSTRSRGDRVSVEIADDGPGIPEEIRGRIFDAFFTTKAVGQGAGLGLDIAQRIVIRHHGELRLESRPGETRFEVVLPIG
jgi:signal transduction histidine kinase